MNQNLKKYTLIIVMVVLVLGATFFSGVKYGKNNKPDIDKITSLTAKENQKPSSVDFSPFWKVWSLIDEKYVAKSTTTKATEEKVWGAISGLADSLGDPFTVFMPPEENKEFENEIKGSFEGVGMEVGEKDKFIIIIAPLKDTPAYRAGIQPGDIILKIDEIPIVGMRSDQAVKLIRGPKGTTVKLLVERQGKKNPIEIKIVRDTIKIPTIDTEIKTYSNSSKIEESENGMPKQEGDVFVITLYNFSEPSPYLFQNALRQFYQTGKNKLILDLRGNPGGYLEAAIDMASWFLPAGKIIVRENYGEKKKEEAHRSRGYDVFNENLKMVILVNAGSASASEILAGALQEYGIAKLVGTKTFGKGSVQELIKITPNTSFKVTIAKWLTPKGRSISDGGLTPDYNVEITDKEREAKKDPQMEKALQILQN